MTIFFKNISNVKIIYGNNAKKNIFNHIKNYKCLLVCTQRCINEIKKDKFLKKINNLENIDKIIIPSSEISLYKKKFIYKQIVNKNFEYFIAIGGGSIIDLTKIYNAMLSFGKKEFDISALTKKSFPIKKIDLKKIIALPTTSGSGSEVTSFATIWDKKNKKKYSYTSIDNLPKIAIVDPSLTSLNSEETYIPSALDALNQSFESLWNVNATRKTKYYSSIAIKMGLNAFTDYFEGNEKRFFKNISKCSVLSGCLINITKTALCHSLSYPLTLRYSVNHGMACAFTMLEVMRYNRKYKENLFLKLENDLNIKNLDNKLDMILKNLKVKTQVKKKLRTFKNIENLIDQMLDKKRALNNIAPVNKTVVREIIYKSWY